VSVSGRGTAERITLTKQTGGGIRAHTGEGRKVPLREQLTLHPTVKPVALVADAIKDCSRRGDIVLDPFGGSGTTLIAAQKSGRRARLIEYDPAYCDVILRRYEASTGDRALLAENRQTFEDIGEQRIGSPDDTNSDHGEQNHEWLGSRDGYESR
jgi:DNA methylase